MVLVSEKQKVLHLLPSLRSLMIIKPKFLLFLLVLIGSYDYNNGTVYAHQQDRTKGLRLRISKPFETIVREIQSQQSESGNENEVSADGDAVAVGPFFGNVKMLTEKRRKKSCGISTIAARALINPSLKRSYFAITPEEMRKKEEEENRQKREVKRSEFLGGGPLPWTCETIYQWKDMGQDHYPRFVRTAECKTKLCFNGFFRCKPRRYNTKVLRRVTGAEAALCEEDDVSLPESLRDNWKFATVTINLCCDCAGRIPMESSSS